MTTLPPAGPGAGFFSGTVHSAQDSIRVESPLPGGLSAVFRFLFNLPPGVHLAAVVAAALVGVSLLALLWIRRAAVVGWFRTRSAPVLIALAAVGVIGLSAFAGGSAYMWHYTQHDNGFCTGCHVMTSAYQRFTQSQHSQLECHSCHQQSIFASAYQLVAWVSERPDRIPPHAKVPNGRCASCHITGQKERWQRVASTAGHRIHLESDSSSLRDIQCVTCHGVEVHQFEPASRTCGQAGCHENLKFTLGKMQSQATSLHCVACHQFTADVPALASRDSARETLVPAEHQCMTCHRMVPATANFDAAKDPHNGTCGFCHNPHTQHRAADAAKTCASAGCHSDWRKSPFHTGVRHRDVATQCTLCHEPHQARVDASDCTGCHQAVQGRKSGRRSVAPPLPFDTTAALRGAMLAPEDDPPRGKGDLPPPPPALLRVAGVMPAPAAADSFPHQRHSKLACITCHLSEREHGKLAFEAPRGCQICHHQRPAQTDCSTCHSTSELSGPRTETIRIAVRSATPRDHVVSFSHPNHSSLKCVDCHTTPVSLLPDSSVRTCSSCHASHHAAGRGCITCHKVGSDMTAAHRPATATHTGCDRCHTTETVARLLPNRSFCLTCHTDREDHYPAAQCTTCHFQESPELFRRHLLQAATG